MSNPFLFNFSKGKKNIKINNDNTANNIKSEKKTEEIDLIGLNDVFNYDTNNTNNINIQNTELLNIFNNVSYDNDDYNDNDNSFCFVIASYNNKNNIEKNLESVIKQNYTKWRAIYINDNSSDNTEELFFKIIKKHNVEDRFIYIKNDKQMHQAYCKYNAYQLLNDFEIVCLLDGDDWLYNENVLERLNYYYKLYKVKIITSNFIIYHEGKNKPGYLFKDTNCYSEIDKKYNTIRHIDNYKYRHLKTGLGILFKSIPDTYLKYENKWLDRCTDVAEMFCVSEFSDCSIKQIEDILYVYNKDNSLQYSRSYYKDFNTEIRKNIANHIRLLQPCKYELPKTFIINLNKQTKHKINMTRYMKYISNNNYTFIEAVDGNNSNEVDTLYEKYQTYFKEHNHTKQFEVIKNKSSIYNNQTIHCTKPVIGLLKSVEKICNLVKDKEIEHILILEDDVYTLKEFNDYLYINNKLLKDKDLIYIGCHKYNKNIYNEINKNIVFNELTNNNYLIFGAYSIILSKKLINYLTETNFVEFCLQANMSWDVYLNYLRLHSKEKFNFYLYYKQLFVPNVCKDGIQPSRGEEFYEKRQIKQSDYNM